MYEIEINHLNYKIEERDREIQYLIKCIEKTNLELVNLKKRITDNNSLKQKLFNNEEYVVCNIKNLTNSIYEYNKELDFADIENIVVKNRILIDEFP